MKITRVEVEYSHQELLVEQDGLQRTIGEIVEALKSLTAFNCKTIDITIKPPGDFSKINKHRLIIEFVGESPEVNDETNAPPDRSSGESG